jgi:hypothetical protein
MSMNPDIKAKWVAALRSGEYKQGTGSLRNSQNEYCCLGVLCEVAVEEGLIPPATLLGEGDYYGYNEHISFLPSSLSKGFNLHQTHDLIRLNDEEKWSFANIADYIEKNF